MPLDLGEARQPDLPLDSGAVRLSGFVSLGSLAGSAAILLWLPLLGAPAWKLQLAAFIVALIWAKHYQNISRLVRGTEKSWKQRDRAEE